MPSTVLCQSIPPCDEIGLPPRWISTRDVLAGQATPSGRPSNPTVAVLFASLKDVQFSDTVPWKFSGTITFIVGFWAQPNPSVSPTRSTRPHPVSTTMLALRRIWGLLRISGLVCFWNKRRPAKQQHPTNHALEIAGADFTQLDRPFFCERRYKRDVGARHFDQGFSRHCRD